MSDKVTYGDIVDALSQKTGFSKNKSEAFTKALIAKVKQELQENGKASITNFGSFKVKEVAERQGQNPQTGEPITIPAHKRVTFTPYKALRETVNAKYAHLESELIEGEEEESSEGTELAAEKSHDSDQTVTPAPPKKREKANNNMVVMIAAVLVVAIIAIASAWFLMSPGEQGTAASQIQTRSDNVQPAQAPVETKEAKEVQNKQLASASEPEPQQSSKPQNTAKQASGNDNSELQVYTVKENEWYWVISKKVYGKAQFWPLIFQENFDANENPDTLEEYIELAVPVLEGTAENLTKADYQRLFEAGMMVSKAYHNAGEEGKAFEYARYARNWEMAAKD